MSARDNLRSFAEKKTDDLAVLARLSAVERRQLGLEKVLAPWDELAYRKVIRVMGETIAAFLENHRALAHVAFVDYEADSDASTHGEMLNVAGTLSSVPVRRFPKRPAARAEPKDWILEVLAREGLARMC